MTTKIKNAQRLPEVYYGLHMAEGVAQYPEQGNERIFINSETLKDMDPSFKGRPVYVEHVDEVNLDRLQQEADGYVIRSFYNATDGKHWCEFIVVSDAGHRAIANGYRLSNAYIQKAYKAAGTWHSVPYDRQISRGEYEHLVIVKNPRYAESVIMTREEFKTYNADKQAKLARMANSKETEISDDSVNIEIVESASEDEALPEQENDTMGLSLFKRTKVENSDELGKTLIKLEKSGKELSIVELADAHDKVLVKNSAARADQKFKVGDEELTVEAMASELTTLRNEVESLKNADDEDDMGEAESMDNSEDEDEREKEIEAQKKNKKKNKKKNMKKNSAPVEEESEEDDSEESVEESEDDSEESVDGEDEEFLDNVKESKKNSKGKNISRLRNAQGSAQEQETAVVETMGDQVQRGIERYGSR